jgi:hypothetical protein
MEVGEKIDIKEIGCRSWDDMNGFIKAIGRTQVVWSWGAHAWRRMSDNVLRFKVEARRHSGHIYVAVNGLDLFDIYLTTTHGKIVKVFTDIYLEDFIGTIDREIEMIERNRV